MDIHYLRFPGAIKPAVQLNNGLFLLCFLVLVCPYLNRAGPLHPTELHMGLDRCFPAQLLGFKSHLFSTMKKDTVQTGRGEGKRRRSRGREREAETSTRCAHLLASEYILLHAIHTCCNSLSLSVCSKKAKSSLRAEAWALRLFSSCRSAIICQTYSPMKELYDMTRRQTGLLLLDSVH